MDAEIIARMNQIFAQQSGAFLAHPYPTLEERKAKLKALKQLLQRYQDRIVAAVGADFGGRPAMESKFSEVVAPVLEINHALHSVSRWMKPHRRRTELVFKTNSVWVTYQPKGVVGVIAPWNFPVYLSIGPLTASLAAGNRAMIKLPELSPQTTEVLARMLSEYFAEDEVAVFGGEIEAAQAFSRLPFNHLVFTGSPAVGHHIMRAAADHLTPVTLELGGKSPAIVSRSGSLAKAAQGITHGKAFNSGQTCVSPDYALVPRDGVQAFATEVVSAFRRMYPTVQGNPDYTWMIGDKYARRIGELLDDATAKGGKVVACGDKGSGRQIPLHIVTGVRDEMRISTEELFGPILPVIPYDSLDDAISYITARPRPLALYPFGFERADLQHLIQATHSGGVTVDGWGWHVFNHDAPFGGIGNSGMGSYHAEEGFRELSHAKTVFKKNWYFPTQLFHPPYGNFAQRRLIKYFLGDPDPSLALMPPATKSAPVPPPRDGAGPATE